MCVQRIKSVLKLVKIPLISVDKLLKRKGEKMRALSIVVLICAYIMGAYDGDSTVAVVMTMLLAPVVFERKEKRKCTTQNARNAVQR